MAEKKFTKKDILAAIRADIEGTEMIGEIPTSVVLEFIDKIVAQIDAKAEKAKEASHALFAGGGNLANMPTVELTAEDFANGNLDIMAVLVKAGLCESRSEARRAVQQGGVTVADEKVTDISTSYDASAFEGEGLIVKRGKKKFAKLIMA